MNQKERSELTQKFSDLSRNIHQLSALDAQTLMDVDTRMSRGLADTDDLRRLQEIVNRLA
ncbi:hypothetical protein M1O29_02695 [Dehalococcoidia bacterium]|nr:hypothetical protein [Dehalococcoidia bacterium]